MPYTPQSEIQRNQQLMQMMLSQNKPVKSMGHGLANALRSYMAGKAGRTATQGASQNEQIRSQEMQQIMEAMKGGINAPMLPGQTRDLQHPDAQALQLQMEMQKQRDERQNAAALQRAMQGRAAQERHSLSPVYANTPDGMRLGQLSSAGGITFPEMPEGYEPAAPSSRLSYIPDFIATKAEADTAAEVDNTNALAGPEAEAARLRTEQVEAARTEALVNRTGEMSTPEALAAAERERGVQDARLSTQRVYEAGGARAKVDGTIRTTEGMIDIIDQILDHEGLEGATGLSGSIDPRSYIPGQANVDAKKLIDTLKNRVFIDTLQSIRANSPTGGAVGNVSDAEGTRMENAMAALATAQSDAQFKEQLQNLREIANETKQGYEDAFQAQFGEFMPQQNEPVDIEALINEALGTQ